MAEPLLRTEGLSLRAGGAVALASVSFSAEARSLTAIIGPDRCDKDALAAVLQGRCRPTNGTLRLAGRPITALAPATRVRRGLAWTQNPPLAFATETLVEAVVLAMTAVLAPSPWDFWRRRPAAATSTNAIELLRLVGLATRSGARPAALARVDRMRLEIARGLATRPHVLVVDRLDARLGTAERETVARLLATVARAGPAVLWIEDDAALALAWAQHVVALQHGRSLVPGAPGQAPTADAIEAAFLGPGR